MGFVARRPSSRGFNPGLAANSINHTDGETMTTTPTIPVQVGELILGRIYGTALSADDEAMLRECHFAGVVLFADNIGTPEEARALTARIAAICGRPGQPAIIALDQEGGRVQRLGP